MSYLTSTVKGNIVMSQGSPPCFPLFYTFLSYNLPSLLKWNKSPQVQVSRSELYVSKPPVLNNLSSYSLSPRIGTVTTETPTSLQIGASIEKKNLTLYNQWNIHKGYYTHGQGVRWKYNGFLNLKMGYFNDIKYNLNYPTLGIDLKYANYILHLGYIGGSENLPLRNTLLTSINVEL